jgi:cell division initiation protein
MFDPALSSREPQADNRESLSGVASASDTPGPGSPRRERSRMNVSPLDLRQQRFRSAFRGFDKVEVASFLAAVADDYEQALRETDKLRQDVTKMEAALNEHRTLETNLKATMVTAQKLADDMRAQAELEAKRIVREAEGRSDLLLEKTQARLEDIQRGIDGLKLKRRDVETTIESTIQSLRNTLEFVREQEAHERDERLLLHRPRYSEQPAVSSSRQTASGNE